MDVREPRPPHLTAPDRAVREGDQPLPIAGKSDVLADLIRTLERHPDLFDPRAVEMLKPLQAERQSLGVKRYGRILQTFNGRDAHLDALQELLDFMVYLHQTAMERAELEAVLETTRADFASHVEAYDRRIVMLNEELDATNANLETARRDLEAEKRARQALEQRGG